jgi:hypothetical protein
MRHLLSLAGLAACTTASGEPRADQAPLVIELFTSQGCSSCPPAEALLGKLATAGQVDGRPIIALSYHVDYWNDLGWADPFSLPAWTERQRAYAHALGEDRVYTPELVVGGGSGVVGSQVHAITQAIAAAPMQQPIAATAAWSADAVTVEASAPAGADVWVAIWQDAPHTEVTRGENAGESLRGDRVVRRLEHVAASGHTGKVTVALPTAWSAAGAVAFAQRPDRRMVGARLLPR